MSSVAIADADRLTCKVCGYKSMNLEPHIREKHDFDAYIAEYGAEIEDLIHPKLLMAVAAPEGRKNSSKKGETVAKRKADEALTIVPAATTSDEVEICGIKMKVLAEANPYPQDVSDSYHFGDHTKDILLDLQESRKILLTGHTGCGKTSIFQQIAARINQPLVRTNLNGQTTIGDFVGLWTVKGGETVWVDGVLPTAMRNGYWLVLDEIDFAEAPILAVLNSVLERNGTLTLKEKGNEVVHAHPNFRLVATANTVGVMQEYRSLYQGTNILNEAFLDRWRTYHIDYLPFDLEVKVIAASVPKLTERLAKRIVKVGNAVREAFKKEEVQCTFSLRRMLDWSEQIVRHADPLKAAEATIFAKVSREDGEVIKGLIIREMNPPQR